MLRYDNEAIFSCSMTSYLDSFGTMGSNSKIYIAVQFDTLPKTFAIVDTGAPWCILPKGQARELNPNYLNEATETKTLNIRGEHEKGVLIQTSLRGVILPPDFWTLFYLRGESPTSSLEFRGQYT